MKAVCTPTKDLVHAGFCYDLTRLLRRSPDAVWAVAQGSLLPNLRTGLVKASLENNASHILFIDSDMRFPEDTLKRLLRHDVAIVGANCKHRNGSGQATARKDGAVVSSAGRTGIQRVDILGFGVMLIKADFFRNLRPPWFATPWDAESGKHIGEDVHFCSVHGVPIYVDHDLSQDVRHAGIVEFGWDS